MHCAEGLSVACRGTGAVWIGAGWSEAGSCYEMNGRGALQSEGTGVLVGRENGSFVGARGRVFGGARGRGF